MAIQNTTAAQTSYRRNIGAIDPIYTGLTNETQVSVTPKRNIKFSFDGQWFVMVAGQTEAVPSTIAEILTNSGVI